jgi:hypothetical protein
LQIGAALQALAGRTHAPHASFQYFVGLSLARVDEIFGVVRRTVDRDWRYARSFIMSHIA